MDPWWTQETAGWIGGVMGGGLGLMGAALGVAGGTLAPRGRGKRPVLGGMIGCAGLGLAACAVGLVALVIGQPYHVWYPLLLCGGIAGMVFGGLVPVIRLRYRQAEQRRLDAEQLRRT